MIRFNIFDIALWKPFADILHQNDVNLFLHFVTSQTNQHTYYFHQPSKNLA